MDTLQAGWPGYLTLQLRTVFQEGRFVVKYRSPLCGDGAVVGPDPRPALAPSQNFR